MDSLHLKLNRWLYLKFNWLRSPIKDLFPEIMDWNVGDEFKFRKDTIYYLNYGKCYLRSISSQGEVLVETPMPYRNFLHFRLAKFLKIAYNKSLKDKQLAVTLSLNTDNILKEK